MASIRKRRGGRLGALDRILLYSPPFATGWGELLGRVRSELEVPMALRELAMCAVAVLNGAEYETAPPRPDFLSCGGTAGAARRAAQHCPRSMRRCSMPRSGPALQLAVEMTRQVKVGDATLRGGAGALGSDRHLFELIGVIAAYNMVSRILVAVGVAGERLTAAAGASLANDDRGARKTAPLTDAVQARITRTMSRADSPAVLDLIGNTPLVPGDAPGHRALHAAA